MNITRNAIELSVDSKATTALPLSLHAQSGSIETDDFASFANTQEQYMNPAVDNR